jgi:LysM repeat protein
MRHLAKISVTLLLAALIALAARPTFAQTGTGTVIMADIGVDYYFILRGDNGFVSQGGVWPVIKSPTMGGPLTIKDVPAGNYTFEFFREDYRIENGQFSLTAGQTIIVTSRISNTTTTIADAKLIGATGSGYAHQISSSGMTYTEYTIQKGDTLTKIANLFGVDLVVILGANPQLTNANYIVEGEVILIPGAHASLGKVIQIVPPAGNASSSASSGASSTDSSSTGATSNVASGTDGGQLQIVTNAGVGECGAGSASGQYEETLSRLSGKLSIKEVKVKDVIYDRNNKPCATLSVLFFGGNGSYTVSVNGQKVAYRGPHLVSRLDGEYGYMDFDVIAACNQEYTITITINSGDGQTDVSTVKQFIPCPGGAIPAASVVSGGASSAVITSNVTSGTDGGQLQIVTNAGVGECGAGSASGQYEETLSRLSGKLSIKEVKVKDVIYDRNNKPCATLSVLFFGGNGSYTVSVNGQKVAYRGPHLVSRLDGEYGYMDFDVIAACNQEYTITITIGSGDGQTDVSTVKQFIPCPGGAIPAANVVSGGASTTTVNTGGTAVQVITNAGVGECGVGTNNVQENVNKVSGTLAITEMKLKDVSYDRNNKVCITFSVTFKGGSPAHTLTIGGQKVSYRGPHLVSRLDGEYGFFDFDVIGACNQQYNLPITLSSADGQTSTFTFNEFVACPGGK